MSHIGEFIGAAILILTIGAAVLLMNKVIAGTASYVEEEHDSFLGRRQD